MDRVITQRAAPDGVTITNAMMVLTIGVGLLFVSGCADKLVTPQEQMEFAMFNARVQDWSEQCKADPNQCAPGLKNIAAEMQQWTALLTGTDPNKLEVTNP